MIIIAGHIKTAPDQVEALEATLKSLVEPTRKEDGCLSYAFAIDDREAGTVLVYERWRDQASLDTHLALPAVSGVLGAWADRIEIQVRKFDALNERDLMA